MRQFIFLIIVLLGSISILGQDKSHNFIKEKVYQQSSKGGTTPNIQSHITYYDGAGRPIQTVLQNGSPNGNDIVNHIEYEFNVGKTKEYLPISIATSTSSSVSEPVSKDNVSNGTTDQNNFLLFDQDTCDLSKATIDPSYMVFSGSIEGGVIVSADQKILRSDGNYDIVNAVISGARIVNGVLESLRFGAGNKMYYSRQTVEFINDIEITCADLTNINLTLHLTPMSLGYDDSKNAISKISGQSVKLGKILQVDIDDAQRHYNPVTNLISPGSQIGWIESREVLDTEEIRLGSGYTPDMGV